MCVVFNQVLRHRRSANAFINFNKFYSSGWDRRDRRRHRHENGCILLNFGVQHTRRHQNTHIRARYKHAYTHTNSVEWLQWENVKRKQNQFKKSRIFWGSRQLQLTETRLFAKNDQHRRRARIQMNHTDDVIHSCCSAHKNERKKNNEKKTIQSVLRGWPAVLCKFHSGANTSAQPEIGREAKILGLPQSHNSHSRYWLCFLWFSWCLLWNCFASNRFSVQSNCNSNNLIGLFACLGHFLSSWLSLLLSAISCHLLAAKVFASFHEMNLLGKYLIFQQNAQILIFKSMRVFADLPCLPNLVNIHSIPCENSPTLNSTKSIEPKWIEATLNPTKRK